MVRESRSCLGPARRARPPGPTFLQIFEGDELYSTFSLGIIPQAVRLKARSRAGPLRLLRSQKNYGKRIYGNYSIDRSRSTLMVGLKRFTENNGFKASPF